ncbi:sulfurtransferase [Solemya velum gill symbiont]|uniref:rhodanese-like domain-containing protein n=1 Tax=Solemya velum gill symbiont TaxID=2340 RepID=UPI0009CE98C6|nr:rhodanese-like domain-containing protein [Solemya velum gill symbiont]OOZ16385.1 sulfurtransferase [Solemya velum gill symbiont]OOZ25890.1 sulfurtransferase [Solemya velum gill symbiont]
MMTIEEIDADELKRRMDAEDNSVLYDIRSEAEVAQGILPNSEFLPMHLIPLKMQDFPDDKEIILYCRSGARSYHACAYLMQQGISNVINLRGGIISWAHSGYEITTRAA